MRGSSSQGNENRKISENSNNSSFPRPMDMLTGEIIISISQEINSLLIGVPSQIESDISTDLSERIIPQMQGFVEVVFAR